MDRVNPLEAAIYLFFIKLMPFIISRIVMIRAHLHYLKNQTKGLTHRPTLFEYYAAQHMTQLYQRPFYVYRDVPLSHKKDAGFPLTDKGIDLIDECFRHIVQVKYYNGRMKIHYGTLSTFLATPLLVGKRNLSLTLVRTNTSMVHSDIQRIIRRGDLAEVTLCTAAFLRSIIIS
jgi:hypothetical protein